MQDEGVCTYPIKSLKEPFWQFRAATDRAAYWQRYFISGNPAMRVYMLLIYCREQTAH